MENTSQSAYSKQNIKGSLSLLNEVQGLGLSSNNLNPRKIFKKTKQIKEKKQKPTKNRFKWTLLQNLRYCEFIKQNEQILSKPFKRQKQKVFNDMHKFVKSRNKQKCKSHHQKMLKRYGSITGILESYKQLIGSNIDISMYADDDDLKVQTAIQSEQQIKINSPTQKKQFQRKSHCAMQEKGMILQSSNMRISQKSSNQQSQDHELFINLILGYSSNFSQAEDDSQLSPV